MKLSWQQQSNTVRITDKRQVTLTMIETECNFRLLNGPSRLVLSCLFFYCEPSSRRSQIPFGNVLLLQRCFKFPWALFNSNKEKVCITSKMLEMPLGSIHIHIHIHIISDILPSTTLGVYSTRKRRLHYFEDACYWLMIAVHTERSEI